MPESSHRVHLHRSNCGKITCYCTYQKQDQRGCGQGSRVCSGEAEEHMRDQVSSPNCAWQAHNDATQSDQHRFSQDQFKDASANMRNPWSTSCRDDAM
jgi:hypothetical protein